MRLDRCGDGGLGGVAPVTFLAVGLGLALVLVERVCPEVELRVDELLDEPLLLDFDHVGKVEVGEVVVVVADGVEIKDLVELVLDLYLSVVEAILLVQDQVVVLEGLELGGPHRFDLLDSPRRFLLLLLALEILLLAGSLIRIRVVTEAVY